MEGKKPTKSNIHCFWCTQENKSNTVLSESQRSRGSAHWDYGSPKPSSLLCIRALKFKAFMIKSSKVSDNTATTRI